MAEVYLAFQPNLKRHVAMKILPQQYSAEEGFIARFIREAEIAASLEHPHIVPIIDFGTQSGINYVVMRLLRGGTLADRVRERRAEGGQLLSLGEIADLLNQISGALDYAHKRNIVHRDIKPNNIMFDTQGTAFLVDFGIAKPLDVAQQVTMPGTSMGTVAYMAPEQWRGDKLTPAVDQYAMGLVVYTLVTGLPPFDVPPDAPYALMHKHVNEMPVPPHRIRPEIPEAVTKTIERAIAKRVEDRYPTVSAFAQEFELAIQGTDGKAQSTGFFTFPLPPKQSVASVPMTPMPALNNPGQGNFGGVPPQGDYSSAPPASVGATANMTSPYVATNYPPPPPPPAQPYAQPAPGITPLGAAAQAEPKKSNRGLILGLIGLVILVLAVVGFIVYSQANAGPTDAQKTATVQAAVQFANQTATQIQATIQATAQTAVAAIKTATAAAFTATPTNTNTPSITPSITPSPTITPSLTPSTDFTSTAVAVAAQTSTRQAEQTQSARELTRAFQVAQTQVFLGLTQTATLWTKTPTPSPSPTATRTPTPTMTPTRVPLGNGLGEILFVSDRTGTSEIYAIKVDGTELRQITNDGIKKGKPSWSPDGQQVMYIGKPDSTDFIFIVDADGKNVRRLTQNQTKENNPVWSPDGKTIIFSAEDTKDTPSIYTISADGSNLKPLLKDEFWNGQASYSPDGKSIVFVSTRDGNWEVHTMDADGSNIKRISTQGIDGDPSISPDGTQIAFWSSRGGNANIYVMNIDGTNIRRITDNKFNEYVPIWSPDGKYLMYISDSNGKRQLYIVQVDTLTIIPLIKDSESNETGSFWR